MRYVRFTLLPLLLVACAGREPVAPIDDGPSLNWMNNTDNSNLKVYRFADQIAQCWTDPSNGLRACHATVPLGGGAEPDCGLQENGDPLDWQQVEISNPTDGRFQVVATGNVFITIRDPAQSGACFDKALVAEGWGTLKYVDNDSEGFAEGDKNADAWGYTARGDLTASDGSSVRYKGRLHQVWRMPGYESIRVTRSEVTLY